MRKEISKILQDFYSEKSEKFNLYLEPFIGGGSVFSEVAKWFPKEMVGSDYNEDLIIMWQALKDGWMPPEKYEINEEFYYGLFDQESSPLRTFILFACSFGGGVEEHDSKGIKRRFEQKILL